MLSFLNIDTPVIFYVPTPTWNLISWHYCLSFFAGVPIEKLLPGVIVEIPLCCMAILLLILSMEECSSEATWGQVSRWRGHALLRAVRAGHAKHRCKERGIPQPLFFSVTSSSLGNVYKLKSNRVRI